MENNDFEENFLIKIYATTNLATLVEEGLWTAAFPPHVLQFELLRGGRHHGHHSVGQLLCMNLQKTKKKFNICRASF